MGYLLFKVFIAASSFLSLLGTNLLHNCVATCSNQVKYLILYSCIFVIVNLSDLLISYRI